MKLHNTMTGVVEDLDVPDDEITLYTCGLTVYSQPHIGNWLGYIYWDVLKRTLERVGYTVTHTQNITDVGHLTSDDDNGDDKMEKGARAEGTTAWDIADKYIKIAEHEAYDKLRLKRPNHLARATDYIDQQILFARQLESRGYTYFIDGEGLYFDTSKLNDYGKLARLDTAGLEAGKRVAVSGKRLVTDFAVWKLSPKNAKRDMEWDSPWGKGFPGWHLECSVIAQETLGNELTIHTGGIDHIAVHHTNEIAQSESITGVPLASMWLHNNHIKIDGRKISKSLGNIVTLKDITAKGYNVEAFKLLALSKHYRTEGNFDWDIMASAQNRLKRWQDIAVLRHQLDDQSHGDTETMTRMLHGLDDAMQNDLDTPKALTVIEHTFDVIRNNFQHGDLTRLLTAIDESLGINLTDSTPDINESLKSKLKQRSQARASKDWNMSDLLRTELEEAGLSLNDDATGTTWSYR